jgi:hypothetical protein
LRNLEANIGRDINAVHVNLSTYKLC